MREYFATSITLYAYEFTSTSSTTAFVIQEKAGTWNPRWFAGVPAGKTHTATPSITADIVAAKISETAVAQTPNYYRDDPAMDGENLKIVGLPYTGSYDYVITIKIVDAENKKLAISCKAKTAIPASAFEVPDTFYKIKGISYICSNLGNFEIAWGSKQPDNTYLGTVTIPVGTTASDWGVNLFSFGVTDTTSWGVKFNGATLSAADTFVELTEGADDNNKVPAFSVTAGSATASALTITVKSTAEKIYAKYTL